MLTPEVRTQIDRMLDQGMSAGDIFTWVSEQQFTTELEIDAEAYISAHGNGRKFNSESYIVTDKSGRQSLDLERLTTDIMAQTPFAFMKDNDTGYYYSEGVYKENAERYIAAECQLRVGITALLSVHKVNEVIGHIRRTNYRARTEFNTDHDSVNVQNGILNVTTRELRPHTPDHLSTVQLPVTYDSAADCPNIRQFFADIHNAEDLATVQELFGYFLLKDYRIQKSVLSVGGGENGKSTELNLARAFLGASNCSHVAWQKLEKNQFASSTLEGKLVNLFADLPSTGIENTTTFKMLTGRDPIDAERKFKESYSFLNFAKLWFSTNKPPKVTNEDSYAFWRRWIILEYPRQFTDADRKLNILESLTTPAELSGLLNYALDGLSRLLANGKFSYARSVEDVTEYYMKASDPVYAFGTSDRCEVHGDFNMPKDVFYDAYKKYCLDYKMPVLKPNAFARALTNQISFHIKSTRLTDANGERVQSWQGIRLADKQSVKDVNDSDYTKYAGARPHGKQLEMDKNPDNPDNPDTLPPEFPTAPCSICRCGGYWLQEADGKSAWLCCRCHPEPKEGI